MSSGHFVVHGEEGQCFMIGTTTQREKLPFTAFFSKPLARFGKAPYTFVRAGVISSRDRGVIAVSFFEGKTDGFEKN
jgi:hypothetical protein